MTRSLGQEGFGEYTTALAFLSLFVILSDLGLHSLMTRELSQKKEGLPRIASNFFTLRFLASLFFLLIGVGAALFFPYSGEIKTGIAIGAIGFLFLSLHQLLLGIFQKYLAMHLTALAEVVGRGAQLFVVFLIYSYVRGPTPHISLYLFIAVTSAAAFIIFVLSFIFARRYIKFGLGFDFKYWARILKIAWPIALSITLTLIYFKIDTIFLSFMKPQADVGVYGVAYRVLESLIFFPAIFSGIMMPILSQDAASNMARFREVFKKSFRVIAIFAFPIVGGGVVLSYSIVNIIGGEEFQIAGAPLQALFFAVGIIFFGNLLGRAIIALDLQKKAVFAYLFGVILNVGLNLIFIPKYTYMGAAWTTVATEFLIVVFLFWLIHKKARVSLDIKNTIKAAFAAAFMSIVLFFLVFPITSPLPPLKLIVATLGGGIIYFGTLWLVAGTDKEGLKKVFTR